jgi:hypothetical protein
VDDAINAEFETILPKHSGVCERKGAETRGNRMLALAAENAKSTEIHRFFLVSSSNRDETNDL